MSDRKIFASQPQPFAHCDVVAYRIEMDLADQFRPMQRHIWIAADGTESADDWIGGIRETPEALLARGYQAVA